MPSPSTAAVEAAVLAVAAGVLGDVDADTDFHAIGGTSLQAMRICVRLGKELGLTAEPADLFDAPTLGAFAAAVGAHGR